MDNVFKKLRKNYTKKDNWGRPMTQSALASELGIKQQTVNKAENGYSPSYSTVKAYHDYFQVPYESLFGEAGISIEKKNVSISDELGLSDEAINNIRNLSPRALALLDGILGNEFLSMNLENLFNSLYGIDCYLKDKSNSKMDNNYNMAKYIMSEQFAEYIIELVRPTLTSTFKDADRNKI